RKRSLPIVFTFSSSFNSSVSYYRMLLRDENLSMLTGLAVENAFLHGDKLYAMKEKLGDPWSMYSIDTKTFAIEEVQVFLHDIEHNEFLVNTAPYSRNGVAFTCTDIGMAAG
ncbi:hypothetical protein PENTCL1PPCAC_21369, partial [Pristionchus entomophagus]